MREPTPPVPPLMRAHPDRVDDEPAPGEGHTWAGVAIAIALGAVLVLIVVLHMTGVVGPVAH